MSAVTGKHNIGHDCASDFYAVRWSHWGMEDRGYPRIRLSIVNITPDYVVVLDKSICFSAVDEGSSWCTDICIHTHAGTNMTKHLHACI